MPVVRSPALGPLLVVTFRKEIPKDNTLPVFWQREVDELNRGKAPVEVWQAVKLVKEVMPGATVSRYYSAEDIAAHYERLKGSLAWGDRAPTRGGKRKQERLLAIPLDDDDGESDDG